MSAGLVLKIGYVWCLNEWLSRKKKKQGISVALEVKNRK
jgi:hypothetical protein